MAHFGALCNPALSHMMNMISIGRELQLRGHRFTLFSVPDVKSTAEQYGISFQALDNSRNYLPSVRDYLDKMEKDLGVPYRDALRYGLGEIRLYCEKAPRAMEEAGLECLVADQTVIAAKSIADRLKVPYITICSAIPMSMRADVPPTAAFWQYRNAWWARYRNKLLYSLAGLFITPLQRELNRYRRTWGLRPHRTLDDAFSSLAQITQLVPEFDFPYQKPLAHLYYVGPYRRSDIQKVDFPYERLDGRPLLFAALGTVLGGRRPEIWTTIAESCCDLDVQLVISLGGRGNPENYRDLPGKPLVVSFAPQIELLKRATAAITHGGLNSVIEALSEGVPLVTLPISAGDQPGVAMRVAACGAGEVLPFKRCRKESLRPLITRVLNEEKYKTGALRVQRAIQQTKGAAEAADIIEDKTKVGGASRQKSS